MKKVGMALGLLVLTAAGRAWGQGKTPVGAAPAPAPAAPAADSIRWASGQGGSIPSGAEPTGYDPGGFLFSCRAQVEGGTHPGKVRPGVEGCLVPLGGREVAIRQYEVILASGYTWVVARDGTVPGGALEVGRTRTNEPLYLCRAAAYDGRNVGLVPGKTGAGLRGCNVGFAGREETRPFYEVLIRR
jgi:hypothetical protein